MKRPDSQMLGSRFGHLSMSLFGVGTAVLVLSAGGCAEEKQVVRQPPSAPYVKPVQVQTDTPTVENAEDRAEDIRKVCSRKASTSPDLGRCWMNESQRLGGKKFEAAFNVMLYVQPDGTVSETNLLNPAAERKELEQCVLDAIKSWPFPTGQTVAPVQCNFYLRAIM